MNYSLNPLNDLMRGEHHAMVDIETMGLEYRAVILSIGIAIFDNEGITASHQWTMDSIFQAKALNRRMSVNTFFWWLAQSEAAREQVKLCGEEGAVKPGDALREFNEMIADYSVKRFWAKSPTFDQLLLESLWKPSPLPWTFRQWLDVRTLEAISGKRCGDHAPTDGHVPHTAEGDAIHQARYVIHTLHAIER